MTGRFIGLALATGLVWGPGAPLAPAHGEGQGSAQTRTALAPAPDAEARHDRSEPEAVPAAPASVPPDGRGAPPPPEATAAAPATPAGVALKARLALISEGGSDAETNERAALRAFYEVRGYRPLWVDDTGFTADAESVIAVFGAAAAWGLDAADFPAPVLDRAEGRLPPEAQAAAEAELSLAVLKYARFARGGRIAHPAEQLNSNLDRKPQLIDPAAVLEGLGAAPDKGVFLAGTHPRHPQFQRLREKYIEALGAGGGTRLSAAAKRLRANMEMWRWMWSDLGDLHLMANVPAYMIDVVKDGETIHSERIVVGELGKQTSIFTRRLRDITFRPMWRVPESIKVNELWPSLLRGGGLMRQYGLEVETKSGQRLDWRTMDWRTLDIRDYEVIQPSGRNSAMGLVKFSFPSQHTIFMHDTPDKWMFNSKQRTLSHGCLRLRNPLRIAELVLAHDKGWDANQVDELAKRGPLNNEVLIDKRVPMHVAYFTAWVDDAGVLKTYSDIYGHEKRVTQALEGNWQQIAKGRDHLAPVVPNRAHLDPRAQQQRQAARGGKSANDDFLGSFFGGF